MELVVYIATSRGVAVAFTTATTNPSGEELMRRAAEQFGKQNDHIGDMISIFRVKSVEHLTSQLTEKVMEVAGIEQFDAHGKLRCPSVLTTVEKNIGQFSRSCDQ